MNRTLRWFAGILTAAALLGGCATKWPVMHTKGARTKAIYPPVVEEVRYVKTGVPRNDGLMMRLRYIEGPQFAVLFGGTQAVVDPSDMGSGITLNHGWVFVNGTFPMIANGKGLLRSLWPIIVRGTMAAGSDGTKFIVDCSDPKKPIVHCVSGGPVLLWDTKSPGVIKATVSAGNTAKCDLSTGSVVVNSVATTDTNDPVYAAAIALAATFNVNVP